MSVQRSLFKTALPSWIPLEAWNGYLEMRKKKKKPMTENSFNRTLRVMARLREEGEDLEHVLNQSEDRGWTGLFAVGDSYRQEHNLPKSAQTAQQELGQHIARLTDRRWAQE